MDKFTPSITNFGFSLLNECGFEDPQNVIISPFSITSALAMTVLGANGPTKTQILKSINMIDAEDEEIAKFFQSLIEKSSSPGSSCSLQVANGVFVAENYQILEKYCSILGDYFGAEFKNLDFSKDESRQYINEWVETVTNEKIKDVLDAGALDEYTKLVLVNAVYFKGLWKVPFKPQLTEKSDFHLSASETVEVDMMHIKNDFNYAEASEFHCSCIELPYEENDLSMVILLPDEIEGLKNLQSLINFDSLQSILNSMSKIKVKVYLPKFKVESSLLLKETLEKMGIIDVFSDHADLSGINGNKELQVSSVIHKSFVEVNEEGTEAAAVTALRVLNKRCIDRTQEFIVNRPFMLLILNRSCGNILFMGKILKL